MTGGTVVILGAVGDNFGAGFTGGMAFVYDPAGEFEARVNPETLTWQRVSHPHWAQHLRDLIGLHVTETHSRYAERLHHDWERTLVHFWQIVPKDFVKFLPVALNEEATEAKRA
jgi:glutamate synthase (NADPH/NADH) large chain